MGGYTDARGLGVNGQEVSADCEPRKQTVAAVGFYGPSIRIGHAMKSEYFLTRLRIFQSEV